MEQTRNITALFGVFIEKRGSQKEFYIFNTYYVDKRRLKCQSVEGGGGRGEERTWAYETAI